MARRTIHLSESTDRLVREAAKDGESYSATVARLVRLGAIRDRGPTPPAYVGSGEGPEDLGRRAEEYLKRLVRSR